MAGKLIVIDGSDGCGKQTQTEKLFNRLKLEQYNICKVEFPNYNSQSSALIKMYLNGDFGSDPQEVNAYAASTFYAADRYASFKMGWEQFYSQGGIILADRYVSSNMIHQGAKFEHAGARQAFFTWLWDFEFVKLGLPVPDQVIFLDMPPQVSIQLMGSRANKAVGGEQKDIHERNSDYMIQSYNTALTAADTFNWHKINCLSSGALRAIEDIHIEIYGLVKGWING